MINVQINIEEVRFIIQKELGWHCYARLVCDVDMFNIGGWHHRLFSLEATFNDIIQYMDILPPHSWEKQAPTLW